MAVEINELGNKMMSAIQAGSLCVWSGEADHNRKGRSAT